MSCKIGRFVLGFDPSLNGLGYGVIYVSRKNPKHVESGVVRGRNSTWGDTPTQVKLALIKAKVIELVAKYYPIHHQVFIEKGFTRHNNSTQAIFRARGAIESELVGYEIVEITPSEIKKIMTNYGFSSKDDVAVSVRQLLSIPEDYEFTSSDESDALAVALAGYFKHMEGSER